MIASWSCRRCAIALAAAVALPLLSGSWLGRHSLAATSPPRDVVIDNFTFGPGVLTVPRGTKVTWTNKDDDPHTVVSDGDPKLFKSPALDTDESFAVTFAEAGTFKYFCSVHPRMQGAVVVQ
jgi:plastocyanin